MVRPGKTLAGGATSETPAWKLDRGPSNLLACRYGDPRVFPHAEPDQRVNAQFEPA